MPLWNYCAICGRRIEVGEPCLGIEKKNTEIVGDSICFDCVKVENMDGLDKTIAITDLLTRAEAAEQKVNELERALSDASKIVNTMQESTIPFYKRRAEEAEADNARLRELVEAVREGRCVVLPCKPSGVTVYQLRGKKHARGEGISPRYVSCATVWSDGDYELNHQGMEPCKGSEFGKTWFLSEDAAKSALKGEQDG